MATSNYRKLSDQISIDDSIPEGTRCSAGSRSKNGNNKQIKYLLYSKAPERAGY